MAKKKHFTKKNSKKPFFSIITVVKNDEVNIEKTIKSILNQNYKNFEYILIDGKSRDKTFQNIKKYKKNLSYILSEKDKGIYYAMNKGIRRAAGKIIVFVNSGDILTKNALKIILNKFILDNKIDFVFGTVKRHYTKSTILKYGFNKNKILYNFDFATAHSTGFFMKKSSINKIGGFNTKFKCSADYDLYFRAIIFHKMNGSSTKKNELVGEVSSGGFSSQISLLDHLFEETKIRIKNKQNLFFIIIIFFNALLKHFIKKL